MVVSTGTDPAGRELIRVTRTVHDSFTVEDMADVPVAPLGVDAVRLRALADAGYRSEAVFAALTDCTDLVVAIGLEGKERRAIDEASLPLTAAMLAKIKTHEAREAYRRRKWLAEPPYGWIENVLGLRQFSMRGLHRVQAE